MAMRPRPSDEQPRQEQGFPQWARLFLSLHLPSIAIGFGTGATIVVMGTLSKNYGAALGAAIFIFVFQQLGTVIAPIPTGFLIDRIGRRSMILAGPFVIAASSLLIVRALLMHGSFTEVLIYQFFTGVGQQMWMLSRLAVIADTGAAGQRGKQITSMFGVQQIGNLAGPIVGGAAGTVVGLWVPFALQAAVVVLSVIPSFYLVKETLVKQTVVTRPGMAARDQGVAGLVTERQGSVWAELRKPPLPQVFTAQFLANVTRGGIFAGSVIVLYASYAYGMSELEIGSLRSIAAMAGIPITFGAGFIMDRFGRKFTIVPGLMLSALAMAFLALTGALDLSKGIFVGAFLAVHLATSIISGNMQTMGTDVAPVRARGAFFGASRMIAQGGSLLSPVSFGVLVSVANYATAFSFLGAAAFSGALVVLLGVPETLRRAAPAPQAPVAEPQVPPTPEAAS